MHATHTMRQVRNLSSCVKVALDFVSPENAHRCVTLTDQFAKLPRGHHLSEDKLQVKTMILHALSHISDAILKTGAHVAAMGQAAAAQPPQTTSGHAEAAYPAATAQPSAAQRPAAQRSAAEPSVARPFAFQPSAESAAAVKTEVADAGRLDGPSVADEPMEEDKEGGYLEEAMSEGMGEGMCEATRGGSLEGMQVDGGGSLCQACDDSCTEAHAAGTEARDAEAALGVDGVPIDAVPMDAVPLDAVPVDAVPVDAVPMDAVPMDAVPVDGVPVDAVRGLESEETDRGASTGSSAPPPAVEPPS